ncbi:MAG: hypothetical protein AAGF88_06500 [Pseudomonadota bacterium]
MFNEIVTNDQRYHYKFFFKRAVDAGRLSGAVTSLSASVVETGDDFIKLRIRNSPDRRTTLIIPREAIHYIEEDWQRE